MSKKVAILQPNYIPWKGYFDLINLVDVFIFLDDVQYTKRDWRNRNRLKTSEGVHWLSIPIRQVSQNQLIKDSQVISKQWTYKHWQTWQTYYSKAPFFQQYQALLEALYLNCSYKFLCDINYHFIEAINQILNIQTPLLWSSDYESPQDKNERLIHLIQWQNGTEYISGPAAKSYLNEDLFAQSNIKVTWMDYQDYPIYQQCHPPFRHDVSVLDLILNEGSRATQFMKSF